MNMPSDLQPRLAALLARAGLSAEVGTLSLCATGANNRTYRLDTSSGTFAAKCYFRHADDSRDRLAAEFGFLAFARIAAPNAAPTPIIADPQSGIALYEFIEGTPFQAATLVWDDVMQAARFFCALNNPATIKKGLNLPAASEACFSIAQHLQLIDARLARLHELVPDSAEDRAARTLLEALMQRWQLIKSRLTDAAGSYHISLAAELDSSHRCLSPSDFGFHNALKQSDGRIRFLDFEYAGWDDPAKMTGDFFSQLAVPVPADCFEQFVAEVMTPFPDADQLKLRARLLRPVYQVKWCCIALNVFLPVNLARRKFANPQLDVTALKQTQLAKAQNLFHILIPNDHGLH